MEGVLRHRPLLVLTAGYTCSNYVFYFFFNWLFIYLIESRGFRLLEGGLLRCRALDRRRVWRRPGRVDLRPAVETAGRAPRLPACPGAVAMVLCGAVSDRGGRGAEPGLGRRPALALSGAQQFVDPIYWAAAIAVSGRRAAAACGVLNTGGNIVGGVGALLVPLMVRQLRLDRGARDRLALRPRGRGVLAGDEGR